MTDKSEDGDIWISMKLRGEPAGSTMQDRRQSTISMVLLIELFGMHRRRGFKPVLAEMSEGTRRERGAQRKLDAAISDLALRGMLKPLGSGRYRVVTRLLLTSREYWSQQERRRNG